MSQTLFLILMGLAPSVIWLMFYLQKDKHPVPNKMILKIFIWGALITPLAAVVELLLHWAYKPYLTLEQVLEQSQTFPHNLGEIIILSAVVPAIVEEWLKYRVVKDKIVNNSVFDEPVDIMLYLIIAGLGFAAIENLMAALLSLNLEQALTTIAFRFLGATFLHTLSCGTLGYFLARSFRSQASRVKNLALGFSLAIIFHILYNGSLGLASYLGNMEILKITALLLIIQGIFVSILFWHIKKWSPSCKLKIQN